MPRLFVKMTTLGSVSDAEYVFLPKEKKRSHATHYAHAYVVVHQGSRRNPSGSRCIVLRVLHLLWSHIVTLRSDAAQVLLPIADDVQQL